MITDLGGRIWVADDELVEQKIMELLEDMAGPETLQKIVVELEDAQQRLIERIARIKQRIADLMRNRTTDPPGGTMFAEAVERAVQRLTAPENRTNYIALLEPNAKKLAQEYPGNHWQTIKQLLRHRVEEKLGIRVVT